MLSINTNLSSLIAQNSMKTSSFKLDTAIERMTTGYKINHAKDNAANYSISTNMTTKIGAYMVAEDNVAMGIDLLATASDTIAMMQDKAARLSALSIQARNGTYGTSSLEALNAEATAILTEIYRTYNTASYNGVNILNRKAYEDVTQVEVAPHFVKPGASGFIDESFMISTVVESDTGKFIKDPKTYSDSEVADMIALTDDVTTITSGEKYSISSVGELQNLADLVNDGVDTTGAIFVLGADIDLSSIAKWEAIGTNRDGYRFAGVFDGNGHVIKNLKINTSHSYKGLFGGTADAEIKNVGLVNVNIVAADNVGALVAHVGSSTKVSNCYSTGKISGENSVGGIVGNGDRCTVEDCYSSCDITSSGDCAGGIIGYLGRSVINCYSTGDITAEGEAGGIIGRTQNASSMENCYATGNVTTTDSHAGGLLGYAYNNFTIENSYATGDVSGGQYAVGGLAGGGRLDIINCYATGDVIGTDRAVGGLVGWSDGSKISNSYATGNVAGVDKVGGLIGDSERIDLEDSYATGDVQGTTNVGGLAGTHDANASYYVFDNCYASGNVSGESCVGGLVGLAETTSSWTSYTNCAAYGNVSGNESVGTVIGGFVNTTNGTSFGAIKFSNIEALNQDKNIIGGCYQYYAGNYTLISGYDVSNMESAVTTVEATTTRIEKGAVHTSLLVGVNASVSCQIEFDTNFEFDLSGIENGIETEEAINSINDFIKLLSDKTTQLGAVQNRLESALDEISTQYENLVSSRSTIRDADMAEVSSEYIRQQILQQASATLMSTANQSPAIALQLI